MLFCQVNDIIYKFLWKYPFLESQEPKKVTLTEVRMNVRLYCLSPSLAAKSFTDFQAMCTKHVFFANEYVQKRNYK